MEVTNENIQRKLPGQDVLKLFRIIAESNDKERINATKRLLSHLQEQQADGGKDLCGDVRYSINRLVQGLASDKKNARVGFSTTLCQLLRTVDSINSGDVLTCIEEKTKLQISGNTSKSEIRNGVLGKAFGILALINSGKILTSGAGEISQIVQELLQLYGEKTYLQLLCINGISQIIVQVSNDSFKKCVLPHIEKYFVSGWDDCSADILQLLITSNQHHPGVVKKFLKEHWSGEQLISEKNFPFLATVVKKSASQSHVIHPVVDQLLACVQDKGLDISNFWKQVGRNLLISEVKVRCGTKRIVGLYLMEKILPYIDTTEKLKEMMQPDMGSLLIKLCAKKVEEGEKVSKKTSDIKERTSKVLADLVEMTSASKDVQYQIEMLRGLISPPGSFEFDSLTQSTTVAQISSQLLPEAKHMYIEELMKAFRGEPSWITPENESAALPQWCIKQLCLMCSNAESSWQLKILQFLFLHSFFNVKKYNKDIPHCNLIAREVNEFQRKFVSDSFLKTLTKLLSKHDKGVPKATNLNQQIDLLYELSKYVQLILQAGNCIQLVKPDHRSEIEEEWNKLSSVISTINKKRNPQEILDGHAFELLFIYFGLQMFADPENIQESLLDLYVCHKKSTKRRKSLAKDDGPAWMDVINELLLSMMFKENLSSRVFAKQVMSFLADHVTTSNVQQIVDALEQTSLNSEEGMVGVDEDEDDDDNDRTQIDDDNVDDDSSGDEDDDEDDDEDSDDSGIEEETDVVVNDKLKEKVKIALGDAAGDSDDEDDDNDIEFSDSEMFKLDSVLASAFRCMTKCKKMDKQKSKQLLDFKTRVLDLVEVILKSQLSPVITKGFILPLLNLVERGMRKPNEENLGNRAQTALQLLLKQKKVKPDAEIDKDELLEMLEYLMKCSNKVPVPSFIHDTGNACLYVLKLLLQDSGISPLKTRSKAESKQKKPAFYMSKVEAMMKTAILDLLGHKPGHCQPAFFHILIVKFPLIFWSSYKDLTDTVKSQDAKVFDRTQAAAFLANMISKELFEEVDSADWTQFVKSWKSAATLVIKEMASEKFKKNLLEEVVATCNQVQLVSPGKLNLDEDVLQKLLEMQKRCDKPIKKVINKLTSGIKRNTSETESKVSGGKKKRKKEKLDEVDGSSSPKKINIQDQSISEDAEMDNNQPKKKAKHHKNKKLSGNQLIEKNVETLNQSVTNGDDNEPMESFRSNDESVGTNQQGHGVNTPKSEKKKKRKSKGSSETKQEVAEVEEPVLSPGGAKKAKLNIAENQSNLNDSSISEKSDGVSASGKKKKKRKSIVKSSI